MSAPPDQPALPFHAALVDHGHLLPSPVRGVWGRGAAFQDLIERIDALVLREAAADNAEPMHFPPLLPRQLMERLGYLDYFPQLIGSIHSFFGDERAARELSARVAAGERWEELLAPTDLMMLPAACYPVYPLFSGLLMPEAGRVLTTRNWCFRHEPSDEPTRLQAFNLREYIRIGTPEAIEAWSDLWLARAAGLLEGLGLDARVDAASDPFFGRAGRMLASSQRAHRLKYELLVPVLPDAPPTAVCSVNWHQQHLSGIFGIRDAGGGIAHSACLGFGLERVALALLRTHGLDMAAWPDGVRARLWA